MPDKRRITSADRARLSEDGSTIVITAPPHGNGGNPVMPVIDPVTKHAVTPADTLSSGGSLALLAAGCAPCQAEQVKTNARRDQILRAVRAEPRSAPARHNVVANSPLADDPVVPADAVSPVRWAGTIGFEGQVTGDGRLIEANALRWEISPDNPAPIRFVTADVGEHGGAVTVGRMTAITRDGTRITAQGDFDTTSPVAIEAARQVQDGLTNGVSMDLDDVSFEIRVAADLLAGDEDSVLLPLADGGEPDADGRITMIEMNADDEVMVTTDARIRAITLVAIPAFADARIEVLAQNPPPPPPKKDPVTPPAGGADTPPPCSCDEADDNFDPDCDCTDPANPVIKKKDDAPAANAVTASAAPAIPPAAWFADPRLDGPTPLQITDEGRVYGHLATFDTCHIATPAGPNTCTMAPRNATGYRYFRTGSVRTDAGDVAVGVITLDARHAGPALNPLATAAHYEHTGTAVADVAAGDDRFGIWVAGSLRPSVTPTQIRALRASPLSGDWRRIGTALELVAALAVNVPGFPVPRPQGLVTSAHGEPQVRSLVAAGMIAPRRVRRSVFADEEIAYLKRLAHRGRVAELRERVPARSVADRAAALAAQVHS